MRTRTGKGESPVVLHSSFPTLPSALAYPPLPQIVQEPLDGLPVVDRVHRIDLSEWGPSSLRWLDDPAA